MSLRIGPAVGGQAWRHRAACRGMATELFFAPEDSAEPWSPEAAKAACARCPVRQDCLDWALSTRQHDGVWGGADPDELRRLYGAARSGRARAS